MKIIKLNLAEKSYSIYIGKDIVKKLPLYIRLTAPDTPLFVITNRKINDLHGKRLKNILGRISEKILFCEVPDSEKAKSFKVYMRVIKKLAKFSKKTKPVVFAFGGGVIGDLAGFVASAYRRGVPYIQVPTTLLGQVDSAIGGKVAIDIEEAKNIVGNFYQPKAVFCDPEFLKTLPDREVRNGLVEIAKYGIIKDRGLFSFLEKNLNKILKRDEKALEYIIHSSCKIKAAVVEKDEYDVKDIRAVLNFGHTIGHAIEASLRYSGHIKHGQAVAKGMIAASFIALNLKLIGKGDYQRISALVNRISGKAKIKSARLSDILNAIEYDKKFVYGVNRFVLPKRIGTAGIVDKIPRHLIKKSLETHIVPKGGE